MRLLILLRPCMHQPVMRGSGRIVTLFVVAILCALAIDCATPKGATVADKRTDVLRMRDETLADLYREEPEVDLVSGRRADTASSATSMMS